jgi:hypothetical protein
MNSSTRALIATTAAWLIKGGGNVGAVYDHAKSKYIQISGQVTTSTVQLYDHERGCHFSGSSTALYDHGLSCHVSLQIDGKNFSGFDHGMAHHFSGVLNDSSISVYDHGVGSYFSYSL